MMRVRRQFLVIASLILFMGRPSAVLGTDQNKPFLLHNQRAISSEALPREKYQEVLRRNLDWFRNSGVLLGENGSKGAGERIVILPGNIAVPKIEEHFPGLRRKDPYLFSEMTRPDCNFETALAFYYSTRLFANETDSKIWKNILTFLVESKLQVLEQTSPAYGLWTWSDKFPGNYWSDDNSWNTMLALKFYLLTGESEWLRRGLLCARGLLRYPDLRGGLRGRPHWGGMRAMALAYSYALTQEADFRTAALDYLHSDYKNLILDADGKPTKRPYTTSESAYFLLECSLIYRATGDPIALKCLNIIGEYLLSKQDISGLLPGETRWGAAGNHIADLVYTQNWFTLAMWHAYLVTDNTRYKKSFLQSLNFLTDIQDQGPETETQGCWRGAFDALAWDWGGTDHYEGGPGSIYTGWTNAPIDLAIEFYLTGDSLLPPDLSAQQKATIESVRKSLKTEKQ